MNTYNLTISSVFILICIIIISTCSQSLAAGTRTPTHVPSKTQIPPGPMMSHTHTKLGPSKTVVIPMSTTSTTAGATTTGAPMGSHTHVPSKTMIPPGPMMSHTKTMEMMASTTSTSMASTTSTTAAPPMMSHTHAGMMSHTKSMGEMMSTTSTSSAPPPATTSTSAAPPPTTSTSGGGTPPAHTMSMAYTESEDESISMSKSVVMAVPSTSSTTTPPTSSTTLTPPPPTTSATTAAPPIPPTTSTQAGPTSTAAPVAPGTKIIVLALVQGTTKTGQEILKALAEFLGLPESALRIIKSDTSDIQFTLNDVSASQQVIANEKVTALKSNTTALALMGAAGVSEVTQPPAPSPAADEFPVIPVAAGAGGGLLLIIIIIAVVMSKKSAGDTDDTVAAKDYRNQGRSDGAFFDQSPADQPMLQVPVRGGGL